MSKENENKELENSVEEVKEEVSNTEDTNKESVSEKDDVLVKECEEEIIIEDEDRNLSEEENKELDDFDKIDDNPSFGKRFFANILDQIILGSISLLVIVIFALIIRIFGYMIAMPVPMFLVAYIVLNILYVPVFEHKGGRTIGKRILAIR
ncbi:RDD family protein [Clostridium thermobutyricum]|uniref:RDD family protein n=1 Tax=Clostridium thermobutyricum TaxID=29372 RepID=UPI002587CD7A|nr:RDD family protein [Clostridium thermobutyricum]